MIPAELYIQTRSAPTHRLNALQTLISLGIPFAVVKSYTYHRLISGYNKPDYFAIVQIKNYGEAHRLGFVAHRNRDTKEVRGISHPDVCEMTLRPSLIDWFKDNQNLFRCVISTKDGKVYECTNIKKTQYDNA
jgi:hypothetical protein